MKLTLQLMIESDDQQQMTWIDRNAHELLQVRKAVLNDELRGHIKHWYPTMVANEMASTKAA